MFSAWVQAQNLFLFELSKETHWNAWLKALVLFPFRQTENLILSALLGVWMGLLWKVRPLRVLAWMGLVFLCAFTILDQIAFKYFSEHLQLSMADGGGPDFVSLLSSIRAESGAWVFLNTLIALNGICFLMIPKTADALFLKWLQWMRSLRSPLGISTCVVYVGLCLYVWIGTPQSPMDQAPFLVFLNSVKAAQTLRLHPESECKTLSRSEIESLRFGKAQPLPERDELRKSLQSRKNPPHLILILLESVGSLQLLKDGVPDAQLTPRLYALSQNALIADRVYNTFPATIRTHVPILTGGRTLTWGSVFDELSLPYQGPTLISELKKNHYKTALFSSQKLSTENMEGFYKNLPYDRIFSPESLEKSKTVVASSSTWGIPEAFVQKKAMDWMAAEIKSSNQPIFLQFLTISSHHPYSIPSDFRGPIPGGDSSIDRYRNSLAYVDSIIGKFVVDLKKLKIYDNTVIVIMGDHGQAFAERHEKNYLHKNFLYEENIRNFFMLIDPKALKKPIYLSLPVSIGDLTPTILSGTSLDMPGQNLLDPHYEQKIRYFHKSSNPEKWGLLDGDWKFINRKTGSDQPELYDLISDPGEQTNLASAFPDRIRLYDCLCQNWYLQTNDDFVRKLKGYTYAVPLFQKNFQKIRTAGPKVIRFGCRQPDGRFEEYPSVHPQQVLMAFTDWVPDFRAKTTSYEWTSPSGAKNIQELAMESDWTRTWVKYAGPTPLEEGVWRVKISDAKNAKNGISAQFTVDSKAKLRTCR